MILYSYNFSFIHQGSKCNLQSGDQFGPTSQTDNMTLPFAVLRKGGERGRDGCMIIVRDSYGVTAQ